MGKKSHKKEHKKKSSKKSKHKSSSSSDDQWVEKVEKNKNSSSVKQSFIKPKEEADNWMDFVCNTTVEIEKKDNSKNKEINDSKARMEKQGQSDRELNPYWKNGGNGLPPIKPLSNKGFLKPKVDDNDECSYTSNKTLNYTKTSYGRQSWKKHDHKDEKHYNERHYSEDRNNHHRNYDNEKEKYRDKRHREDDIEIKERRDKNHREYKKDKYRESSNEESYKSNDRKHKKETESKNHLIDKEPKDNADKPLTDSELNALAAKQIKAEIMGNTLLAEEYKQKLDAARNNTSLQNNVTNKTERKEELVVLTRTSSKGYSYPVNKQAQNDHINDKKKKREKVLTHEDGKRVRYFDDDDKYSLKSMFEKEMTSTAEDSNMEFVKLSRKVNARDDEDDVFVEHASEKRSAKNSEREIKRAINEHRRTEKILNSCRYCFDSEEMLKHLFIAKGEKCYLCLPSYKSLTEGHCLIVPIYHYACATDIDEDVWTEMQVFRKVLTSMFKDQDDDVIFFESAMHLNNMPHMVWNCVPVPIEIGDTAPIYFKKAILECETEWAINKKVVDLNNKDVRRAVPKSLPYFAVDFGMQGGYAHVIEDEKVFPNNFAEEIIGGMMDLDHNAWRKKQKEPIEDQLQKTTKFLEMWKEYDFTKK